MDLYTPRGNNFKVALDLLEMEVDNALLESIQIISLKK